MAGSVVSRELGAKGELPPYINLPHPMQGGGPGFYGAEHAPFVIEADPTQPDFEVKDLQPAGRLSGERRSLRRRLLAGIDQLERERNRGRAEVMSTYYEKAYSLMTGHHPRLDTLPPEVRLMLPEDVPLRRRGELDRERIPPEALERCFALFRAALEPLAAAGKLGYVLFQRQEIRA